MGKEVAGTEAAVKAAAAVGVQVVPYVKAVHYAATASLDHYYSDDACELLRRKVPI